MEVSGFFGAASASTAPAAAVRRRHGVDAANQNGGSGDGGDEAAPSTPGATMSLLITACLGVMELMMGRMNVKV